MAVLSNCINMRLGGIKRGDSGDLDLYCAGKSRGGMSVRIHAAVNASLPPRIISAARLLNNRGTN
jgi:hypothetical protein